MVRVNMVHVLKQWRGIEKHMTTLIIAVNFDGTVQPLTLASFPSDCNKKEGN